MIDLKIDTNIKNHYYPYIESMDLDTIMALVSNKTENEITDDILALIIYRFVNKDDNTLSTFSSGELIKLSTIFKNISLNEFVGDKTLKMFKMFLKKHKSFLIEVDKHCGTSLFVDFKNSLLRANKLFKLLPKYNKMVNNNFRKYKGKWRSPTYKN